MKHTLFALAAILASVDVVSAAEKQPNIVVIKTDDQAEWSLGCYGNKESKSPAIDKLASQGARFQNAFVVTPGPAHQILAFANTFSRYFGSSAHSNRLFFRPRLFVFS